MPEDILGTLDDYPTRSGYVITPVVIAIDGDRPIIANPDEVAQRHSQLRSAHPSVALSRQYDEIRLSAAE